MYDFYPDQTDLNKVTHQTWPGEVRRRRRQQVVEDSGAVRQLMSQVFDGAPVEITPRGLSTAEQQTQVAASEVAA